MSWTAKVKEIVTLGDFIEVRCDFVDGEIPQMTGVILNIDVENIKARTGSLADNLEQIIGEYADAEEKIALPMSDPQLEAALQENRGRSIAARPHPEGKAPGSKPDLLPEAE